MEVRGLHVLDDISAGLVVAERGGAVLVDLGRGESPAVVRAARALLTDLGRVAGCRARLAQGDEHARVVVGTIGVSPAVDAAVGAGLLDIEPLRDERGRLRWESFVIAVRDDVLYVVGSDRRGTIFAVYELCERIGVSPWSWWADVPVHERAHITLPRDTAVYDWPGVAYRGVFLNDEEELDAWSQAHTGDQTIGPETYERVFELVLRLKGNYIWPAMHVNAFNHDPANGRLAEEMGVVVGTSHCDMLLRSNEREFGPWAAAQGEPVDYDYSLPGRNRELLQDYWRGSVRQNRGYEVSWTVGMRGIHDYGFRTEAIDTDEHLSEAQKHRARIALLGKVIADQRRILSDELDEDARYALQLFIPYKEVLPLYDAGLDVPDDVTIVWADDNFGYVRRFPTEAELTRSGGHGLYYHSSYWSRPPRSYLATSSTPLALMRAELSKAWDRGIRKLWVDNVGGLKPLELETEYFLRCAWEAGKETTTTDVVRFVEQWTDATFTGDHGTQVAQLYADYYQLGNQRKIEHLAAGAFSPTAHEDEAGRRVAALQDLYRDSTELLLSLPPAEREAFFQLVAVKIHLAYLVSAQFAAADRSVLAHDRGQLPAADRHLAESRVLDAHKRALLHYYDTVMSGGKWRHIFTPERFPPPVMALHPAARPALKIGAGPALGACTIDGQRAEEPAVVRFWPHGTDTRWIEVFTRGAPAAFRITHDDWIGVDRPTGTVETVQRIEVHVTDLLSQAGRTGRIEITSPEDGTSITIEVEVAPDPLLPDGFIGTVEADGFVCLDPARPDRRHDGPASTWHVVPHLGRYANAAVVAQQIATEIGPVAAEPAWLEFDLHLVTAGAHVLELHRLPTLDSTGRIRVASSVDGAPQVVLESATTDEYRGAWTDAVLDNVERLSARLPFLEPGPHTLRLLAVDPGVALSKVVIHTERPGRSNLGPPFSHHTAREASTTQPAPWPGPDLAELDRVAREVYCTTPSDVPLPPVVYTGPGFWDSDTTFKPNVSRPQDRLGQPRDWSAGDGDGKDVLAALGTGVILESGGRVALEAENALVEDSTTWTTSSLDEPATCWTHTQAETDGGTGLAMHVPDRGRTWDDPGAAPGLHYTLDVSTPGRYHAWLLVKFDGYDDDACVLAIDGTAQPPEQQFSGGELYSFGTQQIWSWTLLCDLDLTAGRQVLSVLARKSGLRIDRIYLTTGPEFPAADAEWTPSRRQAEGLSRTSTIRTIHHAQSQEGSR